jgi:hypothetical protein
MADRPPFRSQPKGATPSSADRFGDDFGMIHLGTWGGDFGPEDLERMRSDPRWQAGPNGIPVGMASIMAEARAAAAGRDDASAEESAPPGPPPPGTPEG